MGDIVWVKTLHGKRTTKLIIGHVNQVNSPQSVQIDGIPRHMKDLCPFMGSKFHLKTE